jgi:asparagine synthase (glutamine-hydrolysing)
LDGDERLISYFDWASPGDVSALLAPEIRHGLSEQPLMDAVKHMPKSATPLQCMLLLEQRYFLSDHNLNYTDKMSMAAGVEVRVPFLDPDLVSLAARIPDRHRQHGAESKWILKKAMEGLLPKDVIYRSKTGFIVPLRTWLSGPLRPIAHDLLSVDSIRRRGLFDADAVSRLIRENDRGNADNAYVILSLMCIEIWCRRFVDDRVSAHAA